MTDLSSTLQQQRQAFDNDPYPSVAERTNHLRALKKQVSRYQDVFADAANVDFGVRPQFESRLIEVVGTMWVVNQALKNVRRWMRPQRRSPELLFAGPNTLKVTYQPKGVVGIVTPWNMPMYLSLGPLATVLAAGNRAMIKLPEYTPRANEVIRRMLAEVFPPDRVTVYGEELTDPAAFTQLPFDHLIFTGSTNVARQVMAAAAQNLTPVTLELGGKNPAIVADDYSIADAALRIMHSKVAMCGQICVTTDYALIPENKIADFIAAAKQAFVRMFPQGAPGRPEYASLLDARQMARVQHLLDDARAKGAKVEPVGDVVDGSRQMPIHIVTGVTDDMAIAREEMFGPILPVYGYRALDEAIQKVKQAPRPLALYCYTASSATRNTILRNTHSGGATVNDWGWHTVNASVPFGGIGPSGMGTYHGEEGFRELSHAKPVFQRNRLFPTELFYPPVNQGMRGVIQRMWMNFYVGKGDPSLGGTPYGQPLPSSSESQPHAT